MRRNVKNRHNQIIGFVDYDDSYSIAYHIRVGFVGRYIKSTDITFDKDGRMYTFGDATDTLIRNAEGVY